MAIITKEALFGAKDNEPKVFKSEIWGGELKYRHPTVGDKSAARKMAMGINDQGKLELDGERLECALIIQCVIEPKLAPLDLDQLMTRNGNEVKRLAEAILGAAKNP